MTPLRQRSRRWDVFFYVVKGCNYHLEFPSFCTTSGLVERWHRTEGVEMQHFRLYYFIISRKKWVCLAIVSYSILWRYIILNRASSLMYHAIKNHTPNLLFLLCLLALEANKFFICCGLTHRQISNPTISSISVEQPWWKRVGRYWPCYVQKFVFMIQ